MQKFANVRSTADSVAEMEIDEYHVIINNGVTAISEEATEDGEGGFDGFEIEEQIIYTKDEYLELTASQSAELEETVNNILTEIIPSLIS